MTVQTFNWSAPHTVPSEQLAIVWSRGLAWAPWDPEIARFQRQQRSQSGQLQDPHRQLNTDTITPERLGQRHNIYSACRTHAVYLARLWTMAGVSPGLRWRASWILLFSLFIHCTTAQGKIIPFSVAYQYRLYVPLPFSAFVQQREWIVPMSSSVDFERGTVVRVPQGFFGKGGGSMWNHTDPQNPLRPSNGSLQFKKWLF